MHPLHNRVSTSVNMREASKHFPATRSRVLSKAAELNNYPGPMHVLEHAEALALSTEQATATRNLLQAHKAEARDLGKELIDSEATLDVLFATRAIDVVALEHQLAEIASRQAAVRASH